MVSGCLHNPGVWVGVCLLIWGVSVAGLRDVAARVPGAVRRGEPALLYCNYDLEGDALYSVKWYFGRREFYRFTPRERPQLKVFPIPGLADLVVQKNCSSARRLCLGPVSLQLSGRYSCEVSADSPSFRTALVSAYMDVVVTPVHRPELRGVRPRYRVGDQLTASCVSRHSTPPANLTWSVNGNQIKDDGLLEVRALHEPGTELVSALSTLSLRLRPDHFSPTGRLKVRCTASLYGLHWQITENSAELEKPRAAVVVAASNPRTDSATLADPVREREVDSGGSNTSPLNILGVLLLALVRLS